MVRRNFLSKVDSEHVFHLNNGKTVCNLEELYKALLKMKESAFSHHVTDKKNDFSNWILHCVKDKELAKQVKQANSCKAMAKLIKVRMGVLRKLAERGERSRSKREYHEMLAFRQLFTSSRHAISRTIKRLCDHSDHFNCIRCGLTEFGFGLFVGVALTLLLVRLMF